MFRPCLLLFGLTLSTLLFANGCQSCSSCHDYDPPVANCQCGHCSQCGCSGGASACGCGGGSGTSGGCGCGGHSQAGEVVEGVPVEAEVATPYGGSN